MIRRIACVSSWVAGSLFACGAPAPKAPSEITVPSARAPSAAPRVEADCRRGYARVLSGLHRELTITAYLTRGAPELDAFATRVEALLERYRAASGGKLVVRVVTPKTAADRKAALDAGLVESLLGESADGESATLTKGFLGLAFAYGGERDSIKQLATSNADGLDFWITNKIREIVDRGEGIKHRVGVLTGHGELRIDEPNLVAHASGRATLRQIISQNFPFYSLEDVDLTKNDREIDSSFDGLVVTQPSTDLSDKELSRIDRFVTSGKSLAVFAGAANLTPSDATMQATLDTHGIERLLSGYGLELGRDVVLDFGGAFAVPVQTQSGQVTVRFPTMLSVDAQRLDASFAPFFALDRLAVPFASSIVVHKEKQPRASFSVVARSSARATALTTRAVDLRPLQAWKLQASPKQFVVAASVTGAIQPAFPAAGGKPADAARSARVLVVASSQFLANPFARAGNPPDIGGEMSAMMPLPGDDTLTALAGPYATSALTNTILAFKNTLDWMASDEDMIACAHPGRTPETKP